MTRCSPPHDLADSSHVTAPEDVRHAKFRHHMVVFNAGNFSMAWGEWTGKGRRWCLAMRWNETDKPSGYPPNQWFTLPTWLSGEIVKMLAEQTPVGCRDALDEVRASLGQ